MPSLYSNGAARQSAQQAMQAGRFAEAENLARQYLDSHAAEPLALALLALLLQRQDRSAEGARILRDHLAAIADSAAAQGASVVSHI
jgi:hypothetical protein